MVVDVGERMNDEMIEEIKITGLILLGVMLLLTSYAVTLNGSAVLLAIIGTCSIMIALRRVK